MAGDRVHYSPVFRMDRPGQQDSPPTRNASRHQDRLSQSRTPLVHGSIGDLHSGELANEGLKLEDGLQGSLADLGLVGCVGGQKLPPGTEAVDHQGNKMLVDPGSQEGKDPGRIPAFQLAESIQQLGFAQGGRQVKR